MKALNEINEWKEMINEVIQANWETPIQLKNRYTKASILDHNQVVFNLKGNNYRLLVQISYKNKIINIKKIGTHDDYMKW